MCGKTKEKEAILLSYDWEKLAQGQGCLGWCGVEWVSENILFAQII